MNLFLNRYLSIHIKPTIPTLNTFYVHLVVRLFHEVTVCTHIHYVHKKLPLGLLFYYLDRTPQKTNFTTNYTCVHSIRWDKK